MFTLASMKLADAQNFEESAMCMNGFLPDVATERLTKWAEDISSIGRDGETLAVLVSQTHGGRKGNTFVCKLLLCNIDAGPQSVQAALLRVAREKKCNRIEAEVYGKKMLRWWTQFAAFQQEGDLVVASVSTKKRAEPEANANAAKVKAEPKIKTEPHVKAANVKTERKIKTEPTTIKEAGKVWIRRYSNKRLITI